MKIVLDTRFNHCKTPRLALFWWRSPFSLEPDWTTLIMFIPCCLFSLEKLYRQTFLQIIFFYSTTAFMTWFWVLLFLLFFCHHFSLSKCFCRKVSWYRTVYYLFTLSFISLHLLLCCTWSYEVFLLNVVLKSRCRMFFYLLQCHSLFWSSGSLCYVQNNSCQWRDETFKVKSGQMLFFYSLDLVFVFVSFGSENSILFLFFHLYCVATIHFESF